MIGCSIAYQLAKRGIESTVLEQSRFGSGASGATAGIIGPLWYVDRAVGPYFELGMRSLEMFPTLAAELQEAGVDPEFRQNGILKPALNPEHLNALKHNLAWQGEMGMGVRWLERDEVIEREPEIHPEVLGGVFSPREGSVRGKSYVDALVHAGSKLGAKFLEATAVTGLETEGRSVTGLRTALGVLHAEHTVLAAGPWTGTPGAWVPETIPVRPVKGQRVLLRRTGFLPRRSVESVVPQVDGNVLVGATREEGLFDQTITVAGVRQVTETALNVFPSLREAELVAAQAGVRPASPDGVPIMGPVPGWEGLSIASGHDHAGVMLSPGTGELIADYLATGDATALEPFSLSRFTDDGESQGYVARPLFWNVTHER